MKSAIGLCTNSFNSISRFLYIFVIDMFLWLCSFRHFVETYARVYKLVIGPSFTIFLDLLNRDKSDSVHVFWSKIGHENKGRPNQINQFILGDEA